MCSADHERVKEFNVKSGFFRRALQLQRLFIHPAPFTLFLSLAYSRGLLECRLALLKVPRFSQGTLGSIHVSNTLLAIAHRSSTIN